MQMQPCRIRVVLACLIRMGISVAGGTIQPTALRIASLWIAPVVMRRGDGLAWFSVELRTELARRLSAGVLVGQGSGEAQLQAMRNGATNMAIPAITARGEPAESRNPE